MSDAASPHREVVDARPRRPREPAGGGEPRDGARRARGAGLGLAIVSASVYFLTGPGHSSFVDGYLLFLTARSMLDRQTIAIQEIPATGDAIRAGADGRSYAKFGPGFAAAQVPLLYASRKLPAFLQPAAGDPAVEEIRRDEFWAQATNALAMGAVVALIFRFGVALGYGPPAAVSVALAAAFASPLWLYARIDGTEALQSLGVVAAAYLLVCRPGAGAWPAAAAGAAIGIAVLAKVAGAALAVPFAVLCAAGPRNRLVRLLAFLVPLALAAVVLAAVNVQRFGTPFDTGYANWPAGFRTPWLRGAILLLLSPAFGMLFFWPAGLLALWGGPRLAREHRPLALIALAVLAVLLALYSGWWAVFGMAWGPRYLVPAIPLLSLFLLPVFADRRATARSLVVLLVAAGVVVQAVAVTSSYWHQVLPVQQSVYASPAGSRLVASELAPLRIGAWVLHATLRKQLRDSERARVHLRDPPWSERYPVPDRDTFAARLLPRLGVDLWAAPEGWRMRYFPVVRTGDLPGTVPSNGLLAGVVALVAAASGTMLARRVRRAAREDAPS